jgi:hypothetical protein
LSRNTARRGRRRAAKKKPLAQKGVEARGAASILVTIGYLLLPSRVTEVAPNVPHFTGHYALSEAVKFSFGFGIEVNVAGDETTFHSVPTCHFYLPRFVFICQRVVTFSARWRFLFTVPL